MHSNDILVLIIISLLLVLLPAPGLYKMFQKAGIPAWKAFVPYLNTWEIIKCCKNQEALVLLAVHPCRRMVYYYLALYRICKTVWQIQTIPACVNGISPFSLFSLYWL